MSDSKYNYKSCLECNGEGFIIAKYSKSIHSCIHCNGSGTTSHGQSEAEKTFLIKVAWDYIHGKEKGWYH